MTSTLIGKLGYDHTTGAHALTSGVIYEQIAQVNRGKNNSRHRQSIMGVANYNYDQTYYLDAVVNYSGSSVLEEGSQFNLYPAIGAGWVISNSGALSSGGIVDYLKLKGSFGYSGSDLFAHDLFLQTFGDAGYTYYFGDSNISSSGFADGDLPVEVVCTELSRKADVGIEATLFKNLNLSASYFDEYRSRILVDNDALVSAALGANIPQSCEGIVGNRGVELALNYQGVIKDFGYMVSGNFTYAKSRIIENNEGYKEEDYLYKVGDSVDAFYGLQSAGFFASQDDIDSWAEQKYGDVMPGDIKYVDQNNDNVIDDNDIVKLGYSSTPEIYYGFNIALSYKRLSLFAQFQGVAHRSIYLDTSSVNVPLIDQTNISKWYVEDNVAWTPETASTATLPRLTTQANSNNYQANDIWMADGSYFKLRNVELSYMIDKSKLKYIGMELFLRASNLFSADNLGYADPENFGVAYPTMQSFTIGTNITF